MKKILLALGLLFLLFPQVASAQSQRNPCFYATSIGARDGCTSVSTANPLPVAASVSASITGFTPNGNFANLTATNVSASVALPAGTTIAVQNTGTSTVSCTLGVGSATAVASQIQVAASSTVFVTPGSNTFLGCIDQSGSTSNLVALAGGTGLGAGFGGGGGGAGGSSAITTWGGATLGAATAWGVAPSGNVNGVNANIVAGSVSVSNFPATQAVSAASLPLPTGASTAAKQPAIGVAGTPSVDVLSVQGQPSMTPFKVDPGTPANWGLSAQGALTSLQLGPLVQGAVTTAAPTYTTAQTSPLSLDTTGALRVNVTAGGAGGGAVTMVSGAVASGAYSAGSIAAGALVAGAMVDGADATEGAKADAICGTATGTCSVVSLLKFLNTAAGSATPAGTNIIGKVGIDQTTPGTTNGVQITGGSLAANQSVNVAQFGGVSTATGQVAVSVAPVTATNTALVTALRPDSPGIIALGQTTKSASVPVAIASDQVGTAGTAAANVLTVQGIASMTPISANTAQVNGVTTLTGTGAVGTGAQRIAVGTDTATIAGSAPGPAGSPSSNVISIQGVQSMTPVVANGTNGYPNGAIAETNSATGTTAATTATLAAAIGKTTYICGFSMRSVATAAAAGNATVTGTITGTLNFTHGTGATPTVVPNDQRFSPCIPASATNTTIAVVSPAAGTGGVMSVTAWGFQL